MKLDIGTGASTVGWTTVDLYDERADIRAPMDRLPMKEAEVFAIRSSHALEHVPATQVARVLREWRRVLVPSGTLWVMVPTLDYVCSYWLSHRDEWGMAMLFGLQSGPGQEHKCGFTVSTLHAEVGAAGFRHVTVHREWSHNQECLVAEAVR